VTTLSVTGDVRGCLGHRIPGVATSSPLVVELRAFCPVWGLGGFDCWTTRLAFSHAFGAGYGKSRCVAPPATEWPTKQKGDRYPQADEAVL